MLSIQPLVLHSPETNIFLYCFFLLNLTAIVSVSGKLCGKAFTVGAMSTGTLTILPHEQMFDDPLDEI